MSNGFSGHEVPLVPGTLRGYREWIRRTDRHLAAVSYNTVWEDGVNQAICQYQRLMTISGLPSRQHRLGEGSVPGPRCTCGFYAVHEPDERKWMDHCLFGVIEASGRVIVGTRGFRAEKARIVAVYAPELTDGLIRNYPSVTWFTDRERMLEVYPPQDITTLVPEIVAMRAAEQLAKEQAIREMELMRAIQELYDRQVTRYGVSYSHTHLRSLMENS